MCQLFCHGQVFSRSKKCFSTASHPDEALPVFALFLTAGVAGSRRRAGRARRHRPVCWSELATRQVHEAVRKLLGSMRLSFKKPAKCLKELHSPALQEANTHRLFIKLRWLMDCSCRSCTRARQTPSYWSSPGRSAPTTSHRRTAGPPRRRSCSSQPHWTTC